MTPAANFHALLSRLDDRLWRFILRKRLQLLASRRDPFPRLTLREGEVWDLYAHGMSHEEIARCLTIEVSTVRSHIRRARSKLGLVGLRKDQFTAASNVQRKR